jgi:hypothetical protein
MDVLTSELKQASVFTRKVFNVPSLPVFYLCTSWGAVRAIVFWNEPVPSREEPLCCAGWRTRLGSTARYQAGLAK